MSATQTILPLKNGTKNFLNRIQSTQLQNFLQALGDQASLQSAESLATRATEQLGFTVSTGNVAGVRKLMGLNPRVARGPAKKAKAAMDPALHKRVLAELSRATDRVIEAEAAVEHALVSLGLLKAALE